MSNVWLRRVGIFIGIFLAVGTQQAALKLTDQYLGMITEQQLEDIVRNALAKDIPITTESAVGTKKVEDAIKKITLPAQQEQQAEDLLRE